MQIIAKSICWPRPHSGAFRRDLRCRVNFSEELASPSGFVGCIARYAPSSTRENRSKCGRPSVNIFCVTGSKDLVSRKMENLKRFSLKTIAAAAIGAVAMLSVANPMATQASDRGQMSLGLNGGYAGYNQSGCLTLDYQYSFANHVRIAPDVGFVFRNEEKSGFLIDVDMHFPFRVARGFTLYPLAGATFNSWNYIGGGHVNRFGANLGGGIELRITRYFKLKLQAKYSFMSDTDGVFVGLGVSYVF